MRTADETLYVSMARELREEIADGTWPVGARIPTEADLCDRFGVSRHTVREALRLLRDEGLVASRQGSGTVVLMPPAVDHFRLEADSIDGLLNYADDLHTEIVSTAMERVEGSAADRMGIAAGEEWLAVRGIVRSASRPLPVCGSEYLVHRDFAAIGRLLPRHSGPIFLLIESLFALTITAIDQEIAGATATRLLAAALGIEPGAPTIEVRRAYRTSDGRLAQVSLHTHPAERFRHSMRMRRGPPA